jgi:hypothetical protein
VSKKSKTKVNVAGRAPEPAPKMRDGDKDWQTECCVCGQTPTVHPTDLCGPCCFGEAETAGGNW